MINWTIVTSIVIGLSFFELCKAIATYIYAYLNKEKKDDR